VIHSTMSVRSAPKNETATINDAVAANLNGNDLSSGGATASKDRPLERKLSVNIQSTLGALALDKAAAEWRPSENACNRIFKHSVFTNLEGQTASVGSLDSSVLHKVSVLESKSTFPVAVGYNVFGCSENTYNVNGDSFTSTIAPDSHNTSEKVLLEQANECAYAFSARFPGYTASNISTKGVHRVASSGFVLLSPEHPVVSTLSENADRLQLGQLSMLSEGLVKCSTALYDSVLPSVVAQVKSQVAVTNLNKAAVTFSPADYSSWAECLEAETSAKLAALQSQFDAERSAAVADGATEATLAEMDGELASRKRTAIAEVAHTPVSACLTLDVHFNHLASGDDA